MADKTRLLAALEPMLNVVRTLDPTAPDAAARLEQAFPIGSPVMQALKAMVREGVEARWLCEKENAGVRFSRLLKGALTIDAVHMSGAALAHTHTAGEIDLCFSVSGQPTFDGRPEGWTVYAPNTWHVPTVEGGVMDILYFLPDGGIAFGEQPPGSTAVGLQARR